MKIPCCAYIYTHIYTEVYLARGEVLSATAVVFGDVGVGGGGDGNNIIIYKNNTMVYTIIPGIYYNI